MKDFFGVIGVYIAIVLGVQVLFYIDYAMGTAATIIAIILLIGCIIGVARWYSTNN